MCYHPVPEDDRKCYRSEEPVLCFLIWPVNIICMQCFKGYKATRGELGAPGCLGILGDAFETLYVCGGASLCKFSVHDGACLILVKCRGFSFTINHIYICLCSLHFFLLKNCSTVSALEDQKEKLVRTST